VVISKDNQQKTDIVVAYISSKITDQISETDYVLKTSHKDFPDTGLFKDSVKKSVHVAISKALSNDQFGKGGCWQLFVNDYSTVLKKDSAIAFNK
jgi:hypothetical protein